MMQPNVYILLWDARYGEKMVDRKCPVCGSELYWDDDRPSPGLKCTNCHWFEDWEGLEMVIVEYPGRTK